MTTSVGYKVILDTNVIYPIIVRDILFWFAHYDLYRIKWTVQIFDEWRRVMVKKGVPPEEANTRIQKAHLAFPDATVRDYEWLINLLELPDPDDRHVLAAAISINADIIVTNNTKDFPQTYLESFGLSAKTADHFLTEILELNSTLAVAAFKDMVSSKRKPQMDEYSVLTQLKNAGLKATAASLHRLL